MSGPLRRVKRALTREARVSGHKGGKRLSMLLPTEGLESYPTKARRFVRLTYQADDIRRATRGHRLPAGMMDRPPATVKP